MKVVNNEIATEEHYRDVVDVPNNVYLSPFDFYPYYCIFALMACRFDG